MFHGTRLPRPFSTTRFFVAACFACVSFPTLATAEPPSLLKKLFQRKTPIAAQSLELKPEHGPWLILATTFRGNDAEKKATALARELQQSLGVRSFIMNRDFGSPTTLATRQYEKTDYSGRQKTIVSKVKYANGGESGRIFGVLVGEFTSIDDPTMTEVLQAVRYAHPKCLENAVQTASASKNDPLSVVKAYRSKIWSATERDQKKKKGKLGAAFATRNPLLPDDYFQPPRVDKFVEELNRKTWEPADGQSSWRAQYSLLDNPGRFTVRVATFTGRESTTAYNPNLKQISAVLDRAAITAHKLTMALRAKGEEAYEFHDRYGSYVTIGSFDTLGREVRGSMVYLPEIVQIMQRWCGPRLVEVQDPTTKARGQNLSLNSLDRIPFDLEGKPIAVPRLATSKIYSGSLLGK